MSVNKKNFLFVLLFVFIDSFAFSQTDSLIKVNTLLVVKKINTNLKLIAEPSEKSNRVYYLEDLKNNIFESEKSLMGEDWKEEQNNYSSSVTLSVYLQKLQDIFVPSFNWQIDVSSIKVDSLQIKRRKGSYTAKAIRYFRGRTNNNKTINLKDTCVLYFSFKANKNNIENLKVKKILFIQPNNLSINKKAQEYHNQLQELVRQLSHINKRSQAIEKLSEFALLSKKNTKFIVSNKGTKTSTFLLGDFMHKLKVIDNFVPVMTSTDLKYYYDYHKQADNKYYYKTKIIRFDSNEKMVISNGVEIAKEKKTPYFLFYQISLNNE